MIFDFEEQERIDFEFFKMMHENFYSEGEDIFRRPSRWQRVKRALGSAMVMYGQGMGR